MGISDKFDEYKDKAKNLKGGDSQDKSEGEGGGHDSKIDKAADFINDKTGGKYEKHIEKAADKAKDMTGDK